jgi:hypothetical protein
VNCTGYDLAFVKAKMREVNGRGELQSPGKDERNVIINGNKYDSLKNHLYPNRLQLFI